MSTLSCLACRQASDAPGHLYEGESPYGLALRPFFMHDACAAAGFTRGVCASCKQPEAADRAGNPYALSSPGGKAIADFWLCNTCARFAGPEQGLTETLKDDIRRANR